MSAPAIGPVVPRLGLQPMLSSAEPSGPGVEASTFPGFWQDISAITGAFSLSSTVTPLNTSTGVTPLGWDSKHPATLWPGSGATLRWIKSLRRNCCSWTPRPPAWQVARARVAFLRWDRSFRRRRIFVCAGSIFLDSLDREGALLRALSDYVDPFEAVVTYNGKIFDIPLLDTRFILSRLRRDIRTLPHVDLLFAARRFYRDRFESCNA